MWEPKKLANAKARLEITHLQACHVSPIKTRSRQVPSSPGLPTGRPCSTFPVGREGQRGVPEATHRLTLSGCGPMQGKEADAKEKRMAWNWARCQRVLGGKHTPQASGGTCLWWESRLQRKKAARSPQAAWEATPAPSPCRSTRRACPVQHVLQYSSQFVNLDSTHPRPHSHSFNGSPSLSPAKFLTNPFSWIRVLINVPFYIGSQSLP